MWRSHEAFIMLVLNTGTTKIGLKSLSEILVTLHLNLLWFFSAQLPQLQGHEYLALQLKTALFMK